MTSYGGWTFPETITEFRDNFGETVPSTRRMVGMDGGWNDDGDYPSPTPPGQVVIGLVLVSETRAGMDTLRDELLNLSSSGLMRLEYTSLDSGIGTRYCYARLQQPQLSEHKDAHTDLFQPVTLVFHVPDPHWYKDHYTSWRLDDGFALDDGKTVGEGALLQACSGVLTEYTITHAGNAVATAKVSVMPGTGDSCETPKVQRIFNGLIEDEISYPGVLNAGDELFADGKRHYLRVNGDNVLTVAKYRHPMFMRLQPGANTIRVRFKNAGDAADVRFWFQDTWR